MTDGVKTFIGTVWASGAWVLVHFDRVAATFASLCLAAWMLTQIYYKIKDRKQDDSESGE
jgi:hypothetical protein